MNSLQKEVGASDSTELIKLVIWGSVLLFPETKAALLSYLQTSNNPNELTRIVDFLGNEKIFILEFMKRRLREGNFPEKIPLLLQEMQLKFLKELHIREQSEREYGKIENTFELVFAL